MYSPKYAYLLFRTKCPGYSIWVATYPLNLEVEYTKIEDPLFYGNGLLKRVKEGKSIKFRPNTTFFSNSPEIPICLNQTVKRRRRMIGGGSENSFYKATRE
jgi:hypothetical protein